MNSATLHNRDFVHLMNQLGKDGEPFAFLIDFEMQQPRIWKLNESQNEFLFNFNGKTNHLTQEPQQGNRLTLTKEPVTIFHYQEKFNSVVAHINKGDSYLINLTMPTQIEINLGLEEIYHRVDAKYRCVLKNRFVCFSPETFVQIKAGKVYSFPMKGTIDASLPNAEETIMKDEKEAAEHATIVDLIRNDLSMVAGNIRVTRFRYYERIQTHEKQLGQVSSEIVGDLGDDYASRIGDIVFTLLPAGSVSGAPKKKTLEIIRDVEGEKRGYYTGIAGVFDGSTLDSCVLIRYIEAGNIYRSGGGITSNSNMQSEYNEMIEKVYVPIP
jgi:para-aminobenzoate synthetase component I